MPVTYPARPITDHEREADVEGFAAPGDGGQPPAGPFDGAALGLLLPAVRQILPARVPSFLPR